MLPSVIPTSWKIGAVAFLMAATVGLTYHYTATSFAEKIGGLEAALKSERASGSAKDKALARSNTDIAELKKLVSDQNAAVDGIKADAKRRIDEGRVALEAAQKARRRDAAVIATLRAIKPPVVVIDGMSPDEIRGELSQCRRAKLINEADGEEK